jgi:hypothetical protein
LEGGTVWTSADLAENYSAGEAGLVPGEVVTLEIPKDATQSARAIYRARTAYDSKLLGIISTKPAGILSGSTADYGYGVKPVALSGRVPVKIASDSATIEVGDFLTSSDTYPGMAMKATKAGYTVAKALESWKPGSSESIEVFVHLGYYDPDLQLNDTGDLQIISATNSAEFVYDGNLNTQDQILKIKDQSYSLKLKSGEIITRIGAFAELVTARIRAGYIETENMVVSNTLVAKNIITNKINVSEKIKSPIVETTDLSAKVITTADITATGTAQLNQIQTNEIKPQSGDLTIDLSSPVIPAPDRSRGQAPAGIQDVLDPLFQGDDNGAEKGGLARLIIKGLEGKTVTTIDSAGNASFSGQVIADSLTINNDATIAGNLTAQQISTNLASASELISNNFNTNTASVSGKLIAGEIQSSTINDIQKLLADIKNQPVPDANYYQNIDPNLGGNTPPLQDLIVTGQSNLYNVSVSNSLLVGTTLIDQNSIISLASELKLSSLSTINLFDGAVIIAKDGKITTRGEIIAQGGIRTNEIKALTDGGQVSISNLTINNLTIDKISTNSAIIAAADNFAQNGIFAPAIEAATASAGLGILPANQSEVIIYNDRVSADSLIYLTPTSANASISQLTVGQKEDCSQQPINCKTYFKIVLSTPSTLPTKFNWLIVN